MNRRAVLFGTLALAVGIAAAVGLLGPHTNTAPSENPTAVGVQSSALYCSGLTDAASGELGRVTFINTSGATRLLHLRIAGFGAATIKKTLVRLAPYGQAVVNPARLQSGTSFGVAALVDGGGVRAVESLASGTGETPCVAQGVTQWFASGLSTKVGDSAHLVLFNPSATAAVVNVTTYSSGGFGQPAALQGVTVAPGRVLTLNLGTSVVNAGEFGIGVAVLRGSLAVTVDELEHQVGSLDGGVRSAATHIRVPLVPTAEHAQANLVFSNPSAVASHVTMYVHLGSFSIPTQSLTVAPYSTGVFVATPNSVIPAAGAASFVIRATSPVVATLTSGTGGAYALAPAFSSWHSWVLSDLSGRGFDLADVTNTSHHAVQVTIARWPVGKSPAVATASVPAETTVSIASLVPGLRTLTGRSVDIETSSNSLLVSATAPTSPRGIAPLVALNGR